MVAKPRPETLTRLTDIVFDKVMETLNNPGDSSYELFDQYIDRLDRELSYPLRLSASLNTLRIQSNLKQDGDQGATLGHTHQSDFLNFFDTTISFADGAVSGGSVTSSGAPFAFPATTSGEFRNMALVYDPALNVVDAVFSEPSASVSGLEEPTLMLLDNPFDRIGYLPIESLGGGAFASPGSTVVENNVSGSPTIFRFENKKVEPPELLRVIPEGTSIQIRSGSLPTASGQKIGLINGEFEVLSFLSGSVDFQTGSVSGGSDFTPFTPTAPNRFYRYGVGLSNDNLVQVSLPLTDAATEAAAPYPLFTDIDIPVIAVTLQDDGSGVSGAILDISNDDVLKFDVLGGVGSGGGGALTTPGITDDVVSSALVVNSGQTWMHPNSTIEAPVVINGTYVNVGASGIINAGGSITMGPGSQTKQISYD